LSYQWGDIDRGDLVVFTRPPDEPDTTVDDLIKRVVALPGETVEGRDGRVVVDGRPLAERYLRPGVTTAPFGPVTVPDGMIFVMGDNRGDSRDSRVFGPIEVSSVVGRAFVRIWPLDALGTL
jgi:signal peptidase I